MTAGRPELLDLYRIAVEEYRFQVNLNWDRSKYFLAFNTAVIGVGAGLVNVGDEPATPLVGGIFAVGLISAALSALAVGLQHGYYKSTRDRMVELAKELGIEQWAVASTPGARGEREAIRAKLGKVQNILYTLLFVTAVVDAVGMAYAFAQ